MTPNRERRRGFVIYSRAIWDEDYLPERIHWPRKFALMWLIQYAQFADRTKRGVHVPRGHFVASLRRLARQFNWSPPTVSRFLRELEASQTICKVAMTDGVTKGVTRAGTLYRFVNYELYQPSQKRSITDAVTLDEAESLTMDVTRRNKISRRTSGSDASISTLPSSSIEEVGAAPPATFPAATYDLLQKLWESLFGPVTPGFFRKLIKSCLLLDIRPAQLERAIRQFREECDAKGKTANLRWFIEDVRRLVREAEKSPLEELPPEVFGLTPEEHTKKIEEHYRRLDVDDKGWGTAA